jgi:LysR family transcriptional regulator, chromosome initiation inhibitor
MPIDAQQLATLDAVVREGSFELAARALRVTPSAVSQRVKALEQSVGQVLVRRARPCRATAAGEPLLRLAGQVALLEREAIGAARGPVGGSRVRATVVVNADSLFTWFLPALTALPADLALFDLREDDQDHTAELLRDGTAMAAVTSLDAPVQGCRSVRLGTMRYLAMAAPSGVDRWFARGAGAAGFAAAPMLVLNRKDQLQHRFLRAVARRRLDPPVHYVPSAWGFVQAVRLGLGWGLVPEQVARADLDAGTLVDLAPGRHLDVPLHWQHWRLDSPLLRSLTAAVTAAAGAALR